MNLAARMAFNGLTADVPAVSGYRRDPAQRFVVKLEPWRVARLNTRGPVEVTCQTGQLWITVPGELDDIVLQAGQSYRMKRAVRDIVLSTVGARCAASVGIRPAGPVIESPWRFLGKAAPHFQLEFA